MLVTAVFCYCRSHGGFPQFSDPFLALTHLPTDPALLGVFINYSPCPTVGPELHNADMLTPFIRTLRLKVRPESAGHGATGEKASLWHSPGITDLTELDSPNVR